MLERQITHFAAYGSEELLDWYSFTATDLSVCLDRFMKMEDVELISSRAPSSKLVTNHSVYKNGASVGMFF